MNLEASSWKHQLAVASLVAIIAGQIVRLLVSGYLSAPGLAGGAGFAVGLFLVLGAFFLPFLWWRTIIGYIGAIIVGILALVGQANGAAVIAAAGGMTLELHSIIIPHYIFALLLIGSSVLAWWRPD